MNSFVLQLITISHCPFTTFFQLIALITIQSVKPIFLDLHISLFFYYPMFCVWNVTKKLRLAALHIHTNAVKKFVPRGEYKSNGDVILMREMT